MIVLMVVTVAGLIVAEELAAREEARLLLERRAESVVEEISARLADRQRSKEIYVKLLARESDLPAAVEHANSAAIARLLVPLKATLGLGFIRVYDTDARLLIGLGDADNSAHATLLPSALAGITPSTVTVGSDGLQVVAASPIKGASGIVGAIVVGSLHGDEELAQLRDREDVELLVSRGNAVLAATTRTGSTANVIQAIREGANAGEELHVAGEQAGWAPSERQLGSDGHLTVLVPMGDVVAASDRRSSTIVGGLIVPLGAWVLRQAARDAREWEITYPTSPVTLSVNLSARQFQEPGLVTTIKTILQETGLDARRLKLEVTESAMMQDVDAAVTILNQLKLLGIQLAIDDFGTGYSSLAQLRRLPVDILKIDRAFVSRLEQDPEDEAVVRSILSLAGSLNLNVTGEGIETAEQAGHLRSLGCTQGQGFFYARPMSADEFETILSTEPPVLPTAAPAPRRLAPPPAA
ncbi:MAG: EAL domain-containing protein [Chloroflexota bacterium]